ncbi:hypothetical protein [Mechercharimyces sp. CAU 1602]|uniref:hypothetical protein n=1 Tax=Mechercharimyces sp. CAU 1602 TaxID=2973933 RepID=UPI002161342E|nr:hypothetical protein [Mechercharimyces sp. CAU 1602]MCS1350333.1 hypothetical protein [Mechercharimyces sp. CAU 1602]
MDKKWVISLVVGIFVIVAGGIGIGVFVFADSGMSDEEYVKAIKDAVEPFEVATGTYYDELDTGIGGEALLISMEAEKVIEKIQGLAPSGRYSDTHNKLLNFLKEASTSCNKVSQASVEGEETRELKSDCSSSYRLIVKTKEQIVELSELK